MSNSLTPWVLFKGPYKPQYQTPDAAGVDLQSSECVSIKPGERALVSTGLFLEIPSGFMGQVCPRSGLAVKYGVTVLNAPGIIDADYRGEVKVVLINLGQTEYLLNKGDRIAQLIFSPSLRGSLIEREELSQTERGEAGFGSTGV
jgi:dUTP pyrophosphatase